MGQKDKKGVHSNVNSGADYLASLTPQDRAWLEANMLDESLQFCKRSNLSAKQRRAMDKAKYKQRYDALSKGTLRLDMVDEKNGDISIVEIADYSDPETAMMAKQAIYEKVQKRRHGKKRGPPTADAKDPDQKQVLEDVAAAFQSLCLPRPSSV